MGQAYFSEKPNINIGRTRWSMPHTHATAIFHGDVVPIDCIPVLPGDGFKLRLSSLIRMMTPIVPIMSNIRMNVYSFFVPLRLVYDHTAEFFGENKETAGPQLTDFKIPTMSYGTRSGVAPGYIYDSAIPGSISDYLHKPVCNKDNYLSIGAEVSVLKERAYYLIWNEFFRAQQFTNPVSINKGDYSGSDGVFGICNQEEGAIPARTQFFFGDAVGKWSSKPLKCAKQFDYFTSATLSPQYGPTIDLPLGEYAPLGVLEDSYFPQEYVLSTNEWDDNYGDNIVFGANTLDQGFGRYLVNDDNGNLGHEGDPAVADISTIEQGKVNGKFQTNLIVDLSKATAASINNLRAAAAAQRFLERSNYGSRYYEYLQVHYSVRPPLGLLQVPELLGEHHFNINIQQVLCTAGATSDDTSRLGQAGANSTTGDTAVIYSKGFVEHGFVMTVVTTTHERYYSQGFLREDLKRDMLEFYHPEFATLGDQAIDAKEIMASKDGTFGYQEHWAEYRYRKNAVSSVLNPVSGNGLSVFTLADVLDSSVSLDNSFLYETRDALATALVTGSAGPDYVCDFYLDYDVIRPMPLYSIPGRIDHVGGW